MRKRTELRNTKALVKTILEQDQRARNSDSFLYMKVIKHLDENYGSSLSSMTVACFLANMGSLKAPSFETVRRTRQKLQAEFPELSANRKVTEFREENEEAFRDFAREGVRC